MRRWLPWMLGVVLGGACLWFLLGAEQDPRVGVADGASLPGEASAPLAAAREALPESLPAKDTADLVQTGGVRVDGQVMDSRGQPVGQVKVSLIQRRNQSGAMVTAVSAGDGSFTFAERVDAGEWAVRVDGPCHLAQPHKFVIDPDQETARLDITVYRFDPRDTLSGTVTDEDGAPVAGLRIHARHHPENGQWSGMTEQGVTDKEGRFQVRRRNPDDGPVSLSLGIGAETKFMPLDWTERYPWGTSGIRLRVRGGAAVEILVVEAGTGAPVEEYWVWCANELPGGGHAPPGHTGGAGERHPGGRMRLDMATAGRNVLVVTPTDPDLSPSEPQPFELDRHHPASVRVELPRRLPIRVEVVTTRGTPLGQARVELLRSNGKSPLTLDTTNWSSYEPWDPNWSPVYGSRRLDTAKTDEHGHATLRGPPANGTLALKVPGPGCVPTLVAPVSITPDMAPVRIVVVVGATLRGRVVPQSVVESLVPADPAQVPAPWRRPTVRLLGPGEPRREIPSRFARPVPVDPEGRFAIDAIPPGDVDVVLTWAVERSGAHRPEQRILQTVRALRDGEVREVDLDATALTPITLRGRVTVNGQPLASTDLAFYRRMRDGLGGYLEPGSLGGIRTDPGGRFTTEIPPCELRLAVRLDGDRQLFGGEWIALHPGVDRELEFALVRRKLTVRVLEADGQRPAAGRWFLVEAEDAWNGVPILTADADGVVVVDPAPKGSFHLVAWPPGFTLDDRRKLLDDQRRLAAIAIHLDPLTMPEGQLDARTEQRLPSR